MTDLPRIRVSAEYGGVRAYLASVKSEDCLFEAPEHGPRKAVQKSMSAKEWANALARLSLPGNLSVCLCGEPLSHPGFAELVNSIDESQQIELETRLDFDPATLIGGVAPARLKRRSPDGGIRALVDPSEEDIKESVARAAELAGAGFDIAVCMSMRPDIAKYEKKLTALCTAAGIEFRPLEFVGVFEGVRYGAFKWDGCIDGWPLKKVLCRAWEILVAPDGIVYRCRHDLFHSVDPVAHIMSPYFSGGRKFMPCDHFGRCFPVDVKGDIASATAQRRTSVEVIFEADPPKEQESSE